LQLVNHPHDSGNARRTSDAQPTVAGRGDPPAQDNNLTVNVHMDAFHVADTARAEELLDAVAKLPTSVVAFFTCHGGGCGCHASIPRVWHDARSVEL
jgi:hypothetical protein